MGELFNRTEPVGLKCMTCGKVLHLPEKDEKIGKLLYKAIADGSLETVYGKDEDGNGDYWFGCSECGEERDKARGIS